MPFGPRTPMPAIVSGEKPAASMRRSNEVAELLADVGERRLDRGDVARAETTHVRGPLPVRRLARVDGRVVAVADGAHRGEQADRAGAEDQRLLEHRLPGETLFEGADLDHPLGDDRQRLDQDADVGQSGRHGNQVLLLLDEELGQEPVGSLDPALEELVRGAEVLAAGAARAAAGVAARVAHHRHGQLAALEMTDLTAELDHLAERLVSEDEVVRTRRRLAVGEGGDLSIGAADADLARAQEDLLGSERAGFVLLDDRYPPPLGKHRQRVHAIPT